MIRLACRIFRDHLASLRPLLGMSASGIDAAPVERAPSTERGLPRTSPGEPSPLERGLQRGALLGDRYRLIGELGQGGMGCVWRAEHLALDLPVAIKFMQRAQATPADGVRHFLREARILSALRGPHIVRVLDFACNGDLPYIVMELLEGESLATRLLRVGRVPEDQAARVVEHVARALEQTHELGIVHRDLKPENVFIVKEAGRELIKLLDFGVAKPPDGAFGSRLGPPTSAADFVGTPHYMSPEQAQPLAPVDHGTDVWALGVLAFECLVGYPPFVANSLPALIHAICSHPLPVPSRCGLTLAGFDAWFAQTCARNRAHRFTSAMRAAEELSALCGAAAGKRSAPTLRGASDRGRGSPRRRLRLSERVGLLCVLGVLGCGVGGAWVFGGLRPVQPLSALCRVQQALEETRRGVVADSQQIE